MITMNKLINKIGIFLFLAVLYFVTGKLGLLMAVPPGYATAVWPPSGVSLSGLLIFGVKYWPSIWLGSFLVNIWTTMDLTNAGTIFHSFIPAIIIGLGAALQALLGAILIKRTLGETITLIRERDVFNFLILGGPVSCLVNATIGVTTLVLIGAIKLQSALFSWWTWWVGDSIGVLIFAPILMIFLAQPKEVWHKRKMTVAIPMLVMFSLMVILFVFMKRSEDNRIREEFYSQSQLVSNQISNQVQRYINTLYSLRSFYTTTETVSRSQFKNFVATALERHPAIQALEWDPKVTREGRADFERAIKEDGFPDFAIKEMDTHGGIVHSVDRDLYFPITFAEPFSNNNKVLGFDFMSEQSRETALDIALKTGTLAVTKPISLIQGPAGVIAFMAVYENNKPIFTEHDRIQNVKGFVVEVLKIEEVVLSAIDNLGNRDFVLNIFDLDPIEGRLNIFAHDLSQDDEATALKFDRSGARKMRWQTSINIGGRQWHVETYPTADYFIAQQNWSIWFILAAGLLFVGFLGGFLIVMSGRESVVRQMVDERTTELKQVNKKLVREIDRKEELAQSLSTRNKELEEAKQVALNIAKDAQLAHANAVEAEERFRMIVEGVKDYAIYLLDVNGNIMTWNKGAERFKGYLAQEIIGLHFSRFYTEEDQVLNKPAKALEIAKRDGVLHEDGIRVRKDGTHFWANVLITALKDSQGNLRGFSKITRDITETRQIQQELKDQKNALDQHSLVSITDVSGKILYANDIFCKVAKYSREELIGKDHGIVNSGYHSKDYIRNMWRTIAQGQVWKGEFRNRAKDGSFYWVDATIVPFLTEDGKPYQYVAIRTDITNLKKTQENLEATTQRFELAKESAQIGIWDWDIINNVMVWDEQMYRLHGIEHKDFSGAYEDWKKCLYSEDRDRAENEIKQAISGERSFATEFRVQWPDKSIHYLNVDGLVIRDKDGKAIRMIGTNIDITPRKVAEIKVAQAINAKSEFTSMVSHELRTPLTVIKESVSIVQDGTAGNLNDEQKDFLETAKRNIDRLGRLINDVLDYQKLDAQRMEFVMIEQDLNDVVKEVGTSFKLPLKNKGVDLELRLQNDVPKITFDRDRIIQVLTNLINNAMKFTESGRIVITSETVGHNAVQVSIADSGIGIKEADFEKLFKSFSQISAGSGRQTGGTGLGLVLCKKIIEVHKGKLGVHSTYGKGSTFYFILPIQDRRSV